MENRFQYILLIAALLLVQTTSYAQTNTGINDLDIRTEFIEAGLTAGVVNIEDFGSELTWGAGLTFRATEDFFLQLNYMQADGVDLSAAENSGGIGQFLAGSDRDFIHYDLLLGYNLFQGEFFTNDSKASHSSFYVVGGVGETEFGSENSFTFTLGLGYQVAFNRHYIMRLDMRDYIYTSSLISEDNTTNNIHFSAGLSYLF